jgi:hypothetical protein
MEEDTRVSVDGSNPPTFKLQGSGHLVFLRVEEIPPENRVEVSNRDPRKNLLLWEIAPNDGTHDEVWLWPSITYGRVPSGFKQKFPPDGAAPSALIGGKLYSAGGEAYNANGGEVWFVIRDGKSVEFTKPGGH